MMMRWAPRGLRGPLIGAGLLGALALVWMLWGHPAVVIAIPKDAVQAEIDRRLPIEGERLMVSWRVNDAVIDFTSDGRVAIVADVRGQFLGRSVSARADASGRPIYRDGAFYVGDFTLDKTPQLLGADLKEGDRSRAEVLREKVLSTLHIDPVAAGVWFAEHKAELASAMTAAAQEKLRATLAARPVYRLKETDLKQALARLALRDVAVKDDVLLLTLDWATAAERAAGWGLAAVIAIVAALIAAFGVSVGSTRSGP